MTSMGTFTSFARFLRDTGAWRPGHAHLLWRNVVHRTRNDARDYSDRDHLVAAIGQRRRRESALYLRTFEKPGGAVGEAQTDRIVGVERAQHE